MCSEIPSSSRGFTLIELMVVISIMAMVVLMVGLRLDGMTASSRLRSSARRLGGVVQFLQNQSVVRGRYYFLQVDIDAGRHRIVIAPEYAREGMDLEGLVEVLTWTNLHTGVQVEDIVFDDGEIREEDVIEIPFTPTGLKWGFLVHLINEDGRRYTVEANSLTGMIRYCPYYKELQEIPEEMF